MEYKELIHKAKMHEVGDDVWHEVVEAVDGFFVWAKQYHPEEVKKVMDYLTDVICYPMLTLEEAKEWVEHLTNNDGTKGEHWSVDSIRAAMQSNPILQKFTLADVYAAMNMNWSDRWKAGYNDVQAVQDTILFLDDKDAPKNKMRRYIYAMSEK